MIYIHNNDINAGKSGQINMNDHQTSSEIDNKHDLNNMLAPTLK